MEEKYVLIKPYETTEGTLPIGTEIMFFRGMWYVNGGISLPSYGTMLSMIINDPTYVRKVKIQKNEF